MALQLALHSNNKGPFLGSYRFRGLGTFQILLRIKAHGPRGRSSIHLQFVEFECPKYLFSFLLFGFGHGWLG